MPGSSSWQTPTPMRGRNKAATTPPPAAPPAPTTAAPAPAGGPTPAAAVKISGPLKQALDYLDGPTGAMVKAAVEKAIGEYNTAPSQGARQTLSDELMKVLAPAHYAPFNFPAPTGDESARIIRLVGALSNDGLLPAWEELPAVIAPWSAITAKPHNESAEVAKLAEAMVTNNEHVRKPEKPYHERLMKQLDDTIVDRKELDGYSARAGEKGEVDESLFSLMTMLVSEHVTQERKDKYIAIFIQRGFEHRWDVYRAMMARSDQDIIHCYEFRDTQGPILPEEQQSADMKRFCNALIASYEDHVRANKNQAHEVAGGAATRLTKRNPFSKAMNAKIAQIAAFAMQAHGPEHDEPLNDLAEAIAGGAEFGKPTVKEPIQWKVSLYDNHNQQHLEMDLSPLAEYLISLRGKIDAQGRVLEHIKRAFERAVRTGHSPARQRNPRGGGGDHDNADKKKIEKLKSELGRATKALKENNITDF